MGSNRRDFIKKTAIGAVGVTIGTHSVKVILKLLVQMIEST